MCEKKAVINSSSVRLVGCFSVHSLIVSHDDDFVFILFLFGFLSALCVFIYDLFLSAVRVFICALGFVIGGSCSFVGGF